MLNENTSKDQQKKQWHKPELQKRSVNEQTEAGTQTGTTDSTFYKNGS